MIDLIFAVVAFSSTWTTNMLDIDGYHLLAVFLRSHRCVLGMDLLQSLLTAACSVPVDFAKISQHGILRRDIVIKNEHLLKHVLLCPEIWARAPLPVSVALSQLLVKIEFNASCLMTHT
jgi:hypothetical protein